jgi:hypothetical protein
MEEDPVVRKRFEITRFVVLSGWIVTILVCFMTIMAYLYVVIVSNDPLKAQSIKEFTGIAFGFLIGSFVGLVKDFINIK